MNVYRWNEMGKAERARLLRRTESDIQKYIDIVTPIIGDVRERGDRAVELYTKTFEGVSLASSAFKVKKSEFAAAGGNAYQLMQKAGPVKKFRPPDRPGLAGKASFFAQACGRIR